MALSRLASEREFLRLSTAHCSARRFVTPWARVVKSAPPGHFLNLRSSALYPQLYMVSGASAGSHPPSPRFPWLPSSERAFSSILLRRKMSRAPLRREANAGTDIDPDLEGDTTLRRSSSFSQRPCAGGWSHRKVPVTPATFFGRSTSFAAPGASRAGRRAHRSAEGAGGRPHCAATCAV